MVTITACILEPAAVGLSSVVGLTSVVRIKIKIVSVPCLSDGFICSYGLGKGVSVCVVQLIIHNIQSRSD